MALICTTTRTWITKEILDPIRTWVSERRRRCRSRRRWWQRLFCWFVNILVEITEWVLREVLVPILHTTCIVLTGTIGLILMPFGAAIDSTNDTSRVYDWIKEWFTTPTKITFRDKTPSANKPDYFDYKFTCNCKKEKKEITVVAKNDLEAQKIATKLCKEKCK